jgi:adenylosuccinate synthase
MSKQTARINTFAFCGGAFGDEGKGRVIDEYAAQAAKTGPVLVFRDNGGANAGHTVTLSDKKKIALHQLPSGVFSTNATVILANGMVIHPGDLVTELEQAAALSKELGKVVIDEMTVLALDTHRAFEAALKNWQSGSKGSTGRGISPAYADVLLRHPMRVRDLKPFNTEHFTQHHELYDALISGLGGNLAQAQVPQLDAVTGKTKTITVGSVSTFLKRLQTQASQLEHYIADIQPELEKAWQDTKTSIFIEKSQGIGIDARWGVYPDVTASKTSFDSLTESTNNLFSWQEIKQRIAVIKATYMSSVGSRVLPTQMDEKLAQKIRDDAHEYGATTGRPRDIAYLDIPALRFYSQVGNITHHTLTHMDIAYPDQPIKVCIDYTIAGKSVSYRPDQQFLNSVSPVYIELPSWDGTAIQDCKHPKNLPKAAKVFISFIEKELGTKVNMITTGPQRHQGIVFS